MTQLSTKIKLYVGSEVDFNSDVKLQDDSNGKGAYIKEWNLSIAKPTQAQLDALETEAQAKEELQTILSNRAKDYPSIKDQLDKIYHSGIEEWKKVIKATKDKYPK